MRSLLRTLHLDDKIYRKKIQHGIWLYVNAADHIQQHLFWYGYYEKDAIAIWQMFIKTDSVVVDIGANIGYYSVIAAHKACGGHIYAFEPAAITHARLLHNITSSQLLNIEAVPYAVSNENGRLPFYISGPDNSGMSGLSQAENFSGQIENPIAVSLDDWAVQHTLTKIDFIKMDIEGAEVNALDGMKYILQNYQPVIFIEIRAALLKQFDREPADIYRLLFSFGYTAYEIEKKSTLKKTETYVEADVIIFIPGKYQFPEDITVRH